MWIAALYGVIVFLSTTLGAMIGLGGGVIIKPVLDLVNVHSVEVVDILSACAVFSMSISSTYKQLRSKTKFQVPVVLCLAAGSSLGGVLGNQLFRLILNAYNSLLVKGIQAFILAAFLVLVNLYMNGQYRSFQVKNKGAILGVGLFLGLTASFLGVGGGPINVAFLVFFFSFTMREAAVYSVAVIFFSQFTKLVTIGVQTQFAPIRGAGLLLLCVVACSVAGGLVGAKCNKIWDEKRLKKVFLVCVYALVAVNLYNGVASFWTLFHP